MEQWVFTPLEAHTLWQKWVEEAEELGKNTERSKRKGKQRERPKKSRTLVLEVGKMHVSKARTKIPTAPTVQEDRLRGLWKEGKTGGRERKGTNY